MLTADQVWALLLFVGVPALAWAMTAAYDAIVDRVVLTAPDSLEAGWDA